jgi:hypothetical protein
MKKLFKRIAITSFLACFLALSTNAQIKVLAFYNGNYDGGHIGFCREALAWFPSVAAANGFTFESTQDWSKLNTSNLANYKLIMFFDDYCPSAQRSAFQTYMQNGGAWIGFHACAWNDNPSGWDWYFNQFLGMGGFTTNTWQPTSATLKTENASNAINSGIPATWTSPVCEFYGWSADLRTKSNIKVLQSIGAYPVGTSQQWTSGYYPIIWTNTNYKMMYTNIGHNLVDYANNNNNLSFTFSNANYCKLILNAIKTLGGGTTPPPTTITVQAENYSSMSGVQKETCTDAGGGQDVGYIETNDWMLYNSITVPSSGTYTVEYRVASLNGGGKIQFEKGGGGAIYGSITVPSTGGWQTWTTIKHTVTLTAGSQSFGIKALAGGFNINWWAITPGVKSARVYNDAQEAFILSPNPVSGNNLRIDLNGYSQNQTVKYNIMDLAGKVILRGQYNLEMNGNTAIELSMSQLKSGLYLVSVESNEGVKTQKLVVKK